MPGRQVLLPGELELQVAREPVGEVRYLVRRGFLEQRLGGRVPLEQDLGMSQQVGQCVGERRRIRHAVLAQLRHVRAQALLAVDGGSGEIQVQVLEEHGDAAREGRVADLLGLARHVRRRERHEARGVAHHRVAGLEAFDALLLRGDGAQVALDVAGESVGEVGGAPGGLRQALREAGHAGDEGGQGVEVGERVGFHPGNLDAPVRSELVDPANLVDRGAIQQPAAAAGDGVQDTRRREHEGGDDDAEDEGAGFHGDSSLDEVPLSRSPSPARPDSRSPWSLLHLRTLAS